jgi:folylpolyglutamate synthase/dihydropteroate synthase
MLRDKSVQEFLTEFDAPHFHITLIQTSSHRGLTADEIQQMAVLQHAPITVEPDLQTAINHALADSDSLIVITGSLRTAARAREMLGLLDQNELDEAQLTRSIFEGQDYLTKLR